MIFRFILQPPFEAFFEIDQCRNDLIDTINNLKEWMKPQKVQKPLVNLMDKALIQKQPYGVVLIIGTWNFPIMLTLMPMFGALAAGNCILLKTSRISWSTSKLLEHIVPKYLDNDCVKVVNGGTGETTDLLKERYDYIFYTGNTSIGKMVMKAASQYLTPVTLELGGKNPVYVDKNCDLRAVANRILWGKTINAGQTCIAPDYVMCTKDIQEKLIEAMKITINDFYQDDPSSSDSYGRLGNERHFQRVKQIIDSSKDNIAIGGITNEKDNYVSPTVLKDVKFTDPAMLEEMFGPVLPIIPVNNEDEAIKHIVNGEKPLAMYIFSNDKKVKDKFRNSTSSGGLVINDTMLHAGEADTNAFVMQANVLNASAGYLIEAHMQLATGEKSISIWIVNTNILPYGGSCEIEDDIWGLGEKKVTTNGWNDEGFRTSNDTSYDWKEQLMYRIVQTNSEGKETLLYYGSETENYIKVKPGIETDGYNVTIKIQIYDIFIDYTECTKHIGQVLPNYTTSDQNSVSSFLNLSAKSVDYYWKAGNVKQVAMNAEVAGTPVMDLNTTTTIFDTEPGQWLNIGVEILSDGSSITKTFDELWNMYQHPDFGEVNTQTDIIESKAFEGNKGLLEKLVKLTSNETYPKYEDYISTCQGMLRVLNNALEAILPKTSVDTPTILDIYTIMSDISSRQELSEPNNADLTSVERAFIASQIAMKNELEADIKK
ncbi:Aldehyde dehydrogenase family 3 member B3,Aldehyde dehydrogenase,Aldehyde dehydrogenase family 3 member B2,Fatty aldehyde dehydrogenase,Aldehyde dehydrogenase family 3 member B1,Putative aldehyde dehydrogenase YwdH,Aldehyde dehydrogenase, dimeric NADP-preferring,Aldehyde dehydrogenase family 3 comG,4,4'-diaponeurosporen-aldehyde dehydrogenase,Aldehyde dehydrogenase family 3 member H1,Aldehyde dehydrogenase family 3 member I1, chloroplastic,Aldehyde dehydrogenase family 3 member F1 [Mytilus edulis]|uniref:Aldehyde dehydrogenase domain-containing protein n=1 Tax=Mytilus edulis TaxID=6550 RepID=A0A8S3PPI0_MYTED|nr:Aldehyde dehydrogenase family 3 member B3,Aldehyde dehydrogenase,Aldehyde dehydrogenase family 3 member B2,Fatty aldehyde dehydrogenase,Aldehyde dehydrogenase family 3 member B1,Putative aldehyde dehydrogenase YwdH,Aldehyde dehydrogenase, dimeric NADP-preferring,Aldehyde dehydrogenase family 3 comG,4,4'-diaponeurosporen-aldehyde dehydrogenase,Aldehyde dehydrogenase family 3 member H1,Aldehyde dehydrogenase family 3 member I1, chloroplastic,Aldehyde dehydrogenase family 3 member F1 [Mytilus eduli